MSGLKLCPTCGSDHVIPVVDRKSEQKIGWHCEWCGQDWDHLAEAMAADDIIRFPTIDPIRGGHVE